jgi:hypothetical protein
MNLCVQRSATRSPSNDQCDLGAACIDNVGLQFICLRRERRATTQVGDVLRIPQRVRRGARCARTRRARRTAQGGGGRVLPRVLRLAGELDPCPADAPASRCVGEEMPWRRWATQNVGVCVLRVAGCGHLIPASAPVSAGHAGRSRWPFACLLWFSLRPWYRSRLPHECGAIMRSTPFRLTILSSTLRRRLRHRRPPRTAKASASDASAEGSGGMSETGSPTTSGGVAGRTTDRGDDGGGRRRTGREVRRDRDGGDDRHRLHRQAGRGRREATRSATTGPRTAPRGRSACRSADNGGNGVERDQVRAGPRDRRVSRATSARSRAARSAGSTLRPRGDVLGRRPDTMDGHLRGPVHRLARRAGVRLGVLSCFVSNEGVLNLCLPLCDPLAQDCPGDDLCIPNPQNNERVHVRARRVGRRGPGLRPLRVHQRVRQGLPVRQPGARHRVHAGGDRLLPAVLRHSTIRRCAPAPNQECIPWYEMGTAPPGFEAGRVLRHPDERAGLSAGTGAGPVREGLICRVRRRAPGRGRRRIVGRRPRR